MSIRLAGAQFVPASAALGFGPNLLLPETGDGGEGGGGAGEGAGEGAGGAGGTGGAGGAGGAGEGGAAEGGGEGTSGAGQEPDWKAEAERYKAHSRTWEQRAKANSAAAKKLEELQAAQMTEQEKAVAEARTSAFADAMKEVGGQLVAAKLEVLAAGRGLDVPALVEAMDTTRFVGEDGKPDVEALTAWLDKVAPKGRGGGYDLGNGARNQNGGQQEPSLDEQIAAAEKAGNWALATSLKSRKLAEMAGH